jgi:hypothetical protein
MKLGVMSKLLPKKKWLNRNLVNTVKGAADFEKVLWPPLLKRD